MIYSELPGFLQINGDPSISGVLLHGSHVKGKNDSNSDVDLIITSDFSARGHRSLLMNKKIVDVYTTTYSDLKDLCSKPHPDNANFAIKALVEGRILFERDNNLNELRLYAKHLWEQGPQKPSGTERAGIIFEIDKMVGRATKAANRASYSVMHSKIAQVRCNQIFVRLLYKYHKLHGKWSADLPEMLDVLRMKEPNLYKLCSNILFSRDIEVTAKSLQKLGRACVAEHPLDGK